MSYDDSLKMAMDAISHDESVNSAMEALNFACAKKTYRSFKNLEPGEYIVNNFTIVDTIHGKRVQIIMGDSYMLLPERFIQKLDTEKVNILSKAPKVMIYGGKDSTDRDRLILKFRSDAYFSDIYNGIIVK